ncbi:anti-sigma regulatory factor [Nocardiopsis lambiniae]|uniref:Anti-sigma regulatory factor n=1 Tax=Nocardiopsis lambiniae TaxID=3075539 RepID=A0ABU2MHY5_9ACTN|nr:anti-sigma regulatory factor [Nocardiopsis sp. DSM 44743]MDT0331685.1 anti-sigma regulatory factor [Nocardiopsis sp. DSM 44743]
MTPERERVELVHLPIRGDTDLTVIRHQVRSLARLAGFGLVQQTKLVTAASELARNTLLHGGGGEAEIRVLDGPDGPGLRVIFTDSGPGIPDVERALQDGFSTANGLGMGLGGSKRLVQEFRIENPPEGGARVTIASWAASFPARYGV